MAAGIEDLLAGDMDGLRTGGLGKDGLGDGLDLVLGHAAAKDQGLGDLALSCRHTHVGSQSGGWLGLDCAGKKGGEFGLGCFEAEADVCD